MPRQDCTADATPEANQEQPRRVPGMLLVGSSGRNSGKTEFACRIIRALSQMQDVVGVKVTVVREQEGSCPRGGEGCGACSSLVGPYQISLETGEQAGKDTSRMLLAGAKKVYWLRVRRRFLAQGRDALLQQIGSGTVSVCESNSFRLAVEPDLFVMLKGNQTPESFKPSAQVVLPLADVVVESTGQAFHPDPALFTAQGQRWTFVRPGAAIILAGGKSTRMGKNKALLDFGGRPLIQHLVEQLQPMVSQVLISAQQPQDYAFLGCPVIGDLEPGQGPLMGIASALEASPAEYNLVLSCDLAQLPRCLIRRLFREARQADGAVPFTADFGVQPLFAVYHRRVLPFVWKALRSNQRRVISFFPDCRIKYLTLPKEVRIQNLNLPADYQRVIHRRWGNLTTQEVNEPAVVF